MSVGSPLRPRATAERPRERDRLHRAGPGTRRARLAVRGERTRPAARVVVPVEAYEATAPGWDGPITAPLLWDGETGRIVNNESREIMEMLDTAFAHLGDPTRRRSIPSTCDPRSTTRRLDLRRGQQRRLQGRLRRESGRLRRRTWSSCSRRSHQLDERLGKRRYLLGDRPTVADWRLFTTLVRFDVVYVDHFKCNVRRIARLSEPRRLSARSLPDARRCRHRRLRRHQTPLLPDAAEAESVSRIIPTGPTVELDAPHERARLAS